MPFTETIKPLTLEDREKIKERLKSIPLGFGALVLFMVVGTSLLSLFAGKNLFSSFVSFFFVAGALFAAFFGYMYNKVRKELESNVKRVIVGTIDEKRERYKMGGRTGSGTTYYSFLMGTEDIVVEQAIYDKYEALQIIQIGILPNSKMVLHIKKCESADIEE